MRYDSVLITTLCFADDVLSLRTLEPAVIQRVSSMSIHPTCDESVTRKREDPEKLTHE
jgi:hypothetical protein